MTRLPRAALLATILAATLGLAAHADEPSIDPATALPIADGFEKVRLHCTGCHSGRLVAQNRATREGWLGLIRWMQRTQRLPDLGPDEDVVLDYLAAQLGPRSEHPPRRARLAPALMPPPAR